MAYQKRRVAGLVTGHIGTEYGQTPTGGSGEILHEPDATRRRVRMEALRVVSLSFAHGQAALVEFVVRVVGKERRLTTCQQPRYAAGRERCPGIGRKGL